MDAMLFCAGLSLLIVGVYTMGVSRGMSLEKARTKNWTPPGALPPTPITMPEPSPEPPVAIGEQFGFLGIRMICVGHRLPMQGAPGVTAHYVDRDGRLQGALFTPTEYVALQAEVALWRERWGLVA